MIGRLLRSVDFERVLATRSRASSAHFAVHHVAAEPVRWQAPQASGAPELSTGPTPTGAALVDDCLGGRVTALLETSAERVWLGMVVPKRHARRSVTRSLLKRQMRSALARQEGVLASGIWVLRLRAPFERQQFPSAASEAIKRLARTELEQLLANAAARIGGPPHRST